MVQVQQQQIKFLNNHLLQATLQKSSKSDKRPSFQGKMLMVGTLLFCRTVLFFIDSQEKLKILT